MARRWFGPSQREIWRQLSEAVGGRYLEGGFCRSTRVEVTHGKWTVTLDTSALFELFAMTLDELCRIGAAYARDPEVAI
jgi:hypothetical protein